MASSAEASVNQSPAELAAWLGGVFMLGRGGRQQLTFTEPMPFSRATGQPSARSTTLEPDFGVASGPSRDSPLQAGFFLLWPCAPAPQGLSLACNRLGEPLPFKSRGACLSSRQAGAESAVAAGWYEITPLRQAEP